MYSKDEVCCCASLRLTTCGKGDMRMNVACHLPVRALSTSQRAFNVAPELAQALTREIEAEQQLSQENLGGSPHLHSKVSSSQLKKPRCA
ncbi:hypothetical protein OSTOST_04914 [Ostertagia ostertagi]